MTQITGGSVAYEDGIKSHEEYAPARKVRVELHFDLSAGDAQSEQAEIEAIGAVAKAEVCRLLGKPVPSAIDALAGKEFVSGLKLNVGDPTPPPAETGKPPRVRRTKEQIAADEAAAKKAEEVLQAADPAAIVEKPARTPLTDALGPDGKGINFDPLSGVQAAEKDNGSVEPSTDPADLDFSSEPESTPITDADLNAACQRKAGQLESAQKIKELVGTFNPDPTRQFNLREIPAVQRADFLAKLEALS